MLLLIVLLVLFVIFNTICILGKERDWNVGVEAISAISGIIFFGISLIIGIWAIVENVGVDGNIQEAALTRESLIYQLENDVYDSDNNIGKSELFANISSWNSNKATHDALHDDIWVGILYADIYGDLEYIDVTSVDVK